MDNVLFDSWSVLARTLVIGILAYGLLVVGLRVSGKRTLSKLNAFDLIVTVALGSTLASIITAKDVALAQGTLAFAVLIGLQYAVTWFSLRVGWVRRVVRAEPTLLVRRGQWLDQAMRSQRITRDEVRAAVRGAGVGSLDAVAAVVLETDGSISVVHGQSISNLSALEDVPDANR